MRHWLGLLAFTVGCGEVQKVPDDFTIALDNPGVFIRRGETQSVMVGVTRTSGTSDLDVTVDGLPTGVSPDALTITADSDSGTLTFHADATATEGVAMLTVHASVDTVTGDASLRMLVGDAPGTLDLSFGGNGKFVTMLGTNALVGRGLSLGFGGVIVTGVNTGMSQTVSAKIREDGTLDPAFGTNGIVSTGAGMFAEGIAIATTSDRIVIAGVANGNGTSDDNFGVFGYTPDGNLDQTFGASGVISIDPSASTFAEYHTIVAAADGSTFVGGPIFPSSGSIISQGFHFSPTGVRDSAYLINETGVIVQASVLQPDGKLVWSGSVSGDFIVTRYNANGTRDMGFGVGGNAITDFGTDSVDADGLILLGNGKLVAVGTGGTPPHVVIARYNANGSPDLTFGVNGKITTAIGFDTRSPNAALIDANNRLLLVGVTNAKPSVVRILVDGTPDPAFGTNGIAAIDFGIAGSDSQTGGYGIVADADGRILFTGEVGNPGMQRLVVARLWP